MPLPRRIGAACRTALQAALMQVNRLAWAGTGQRVVGSVRKARLVEQVAAVAVFDLDHPQVGITAALARDGGIHLALGALGQRRPCTGVAHQIEGAGMSAIDSRAR